MQLEDVVRLTKELKTRQETPDSPEALATIPSLALSDIPREISTVPTDIRTSGEATILSHDLLPESAGSIVDLDVNPDYDGQLLHCRVWDSQNDFVERTWPVEVVLEGT